MAITTYSELQTAMANWAHRSDLTSVLPDFITLAEAKLNRNLRARNMEASATLTPALGVCTLPTDYLESRRVYINSSPVVELEYLAPENFHILFPTGSNTGSKYFTIEGSSLVLANKSDTNTVNLLYYQTIPALSVTNTSNWVLASHPDLYLSAALAELCDYIKDDAGVQKWNAKASALLGSLTVSDHRGKYSGSAMRVVAA